MPFFSFKTALIALGGVAIAGWLAVPDAKSAGFTLTTLAYFNGANGAAPYAGLLRGIDESLYGTTSQGGAYGFGTVFKITSNGSLTTLLSFDKTNGSEPYATLVQTSDGNLYGTTLEGGIS